MNEMNNKKGDEINLYDLIFLFWGNKLKIMFISSIFAIFSVIYALSLDNIYRSSALASISSEMESNSNLRSQYGGIASLAGIKLPSSGSNKVFLVIERVQSRQFVSHLLSFQDVLPSLLAVDYYDELSGNIFYDKAIYDSSNNSWPEGRPTDLEAHKAFKNILQVDIDLETGFLNMAIDHQSPVFSKNLLDLIISEVNSLSRDQDLADANNSLEYLKIELNKTNLLDIKELINSLIAARLETKMLANVQDDYLIKIIDAPFVPEERLSPNRAFICIFITFIGFIISLIFILIQNFLLNKIGQKTS